MTGHPPSACHLENVKSTIGQMKLLVKFNVIWSLKANKIALSMLTLSFFKKR
jgi:hypothetical protein